MAHEVRVICFPHDDRVFAGHVDRLMSAYPALGTGVEAAVEVLLRDHYPLARVAAREVMAALDGERVWYVYREGTFLGSESDSALERPAEPSTTG